MAGSSPLGKASRLDRRLRFASSPHTSGPHNEDRGVPALSRGTIVLEVAFNMFSAPHAMTAVSPSLPRISCGFCGQTKPVADIDTLARVREILDSQQGNAMSKL